MDRQHFDDLARALAAGGATRRNALRILTGGALTSVWVTFLSDAKGTIKGDGTGKNHRGGDIHAEASCIGTGRVCPAKIKNKKKKKKEIVGCDRCCQGGSVRAPSARPGEVRQRRCCIAFGQPCTLDYGSGSVRAFCCMGVCLNNICQAEPPPPPPPPVTCVALGQPCPAGCVPNGVCPGCCAPGECAGDGSCGMFV